MDIKAKLQRIHRFLELKMGEERRIEQLQLEVAQLRAENNFLRVIVHSNSVEHASILEQNQLLRAENEGLRARVGGNHLGNEVITNHSVVVDPPHGDETRIARVEEHEHEENLNGPDQGIIGAHVQDEEREEDEIRKFNSFHN